MTDPDPDLEAEAAAFVALLNGMMQQTAEGTGQTVRFTLTLPVEAATLAAWLVLKGRMREDRRHGPLFRPVSLKREDDGYRLADYYRAKSFLTDALMGRLTHEFARLCDGSHFLLRPLPPMPAASDVIDDDIPF